LTPAKRLSGSFQRGEREKGKSNQVMSWLGARLDQRVDDASVVHQQAAGMMGNLGMVSAMGGGISPTRGQGNTLDPDSGKTNATPPPR